MPAGIENFALGLVQGMNARKAEQRQAEQDQMRKQEFDLQQEARQFDLANAKANADNSRVDRERKLALQARGDAFDKHFGLAMSSPDDSGAILALANGFNDPVFGMPYRAVPQTGPDGKPQKDKDGKFIVGYLDPSGRTAYTQSWSKQDAMDKFRGINDAAAQYDKLREERVKAKEKESERAHDMAKIDRTGEWSVKRANATADAARGLSHAGGSSKKPKDSLSRDGLMLISSKINTTDDDGNITTKTVVDTAKLGRFQAWAKSKGVPPNDAALQLWIPIEDTESSAGKAFVPKQTTGYDFGEL